MIAATLPGAGLKVLVLGHDTRSFLAVIRSLGRKGVEVHVLGCVPNSPSLRSRHITQSHSLPEYPANPDAWIDALGALIARHKFDLVIPCDDPSILRLTSYAARAKSDIRLELLPEALRKRTSSKQFIYETAVRLGVPVPKSTLAETRDELIIAINTMRAPYVLKPIASFDSSDTVIRLEVRKAFSSEDALTIGTDLIRRSPIQIQENFVGVGTGVEFLASHGEALCIFQHVRVHEPLHGGGSSYRMGIPVHSNMKLAAEALIRDLEYDGVGMLEFKWNREADIFVLIELNARFWGSLPLAISSGADFPWFLFSHRKFGTRDFPKSFATGICSRSFTQDTHWLRSNFSHDRNDPILSTLPWRKVAQELCTVARGRERIDTLAVDDMAPFFSELGQWLSDAGSYVQRKMRRLLRELGVLRRIRAQVLRRKLRRAGSIEFVCYGNICRSPFAAAVISQIGVESGPHPNVSSSGLHARKGRASPEMAILVARDFGVDLSQHRSELLNDERVDQADLLFVFDWANLELFLRRFPRARKKVFLIGELDFMGSISVEDPYGKSISEFNTSYQRIIRALETSWKG